MKNKTQIIILAAGKGTRMGGDMPKVLVPFRGKYLIQHLLDAVEKIKDKPFGPYIVVGYGKDKVMEELGQNRYKYIEQREQLGTAHAVEQVRKSVQDEADNILVLYGDHPFVTVETMNRLIGRQISTKKKIVMATTEIKDFPNKSLFAGFSRVLRDENGKLLKVIEVADATDEQKRITEVNPCYFCFDAKFLWDQLDKIQSDNNQKERYLTDILKFVTTEDIEGIRIDPLEALGANSKEELEILEKLAV